MTVALLFWGMLVQSVSSVSGRSAAVLPSLVFILGFTIAGYGILSLFHGVKIRITPQWMTDGTRQQILKIRGIIKGDRVDIPCRDIRDVQAANYRLPLWRGLLGPLGRKSYSHGHIITLPGYRGSGLAVTYTSESIFSSESKDRTVLFPTRRPETLQAILTDTAGAYQSH